MYDVYVKGHNAKIVSNDENSFYNEQKLLKKGYEHIWDSAPTIEKAKEYAKEFYIAYTEEDSPFGMCRICNNIPASGMVKGTRYVPEVNIKPMPYKGYVCEQCAGNLEYIQWIK